MMEIAQQAAKGDGGGHIDASTLTDEAAELLQLYLDNQETWQKVCLVLENNADQMSTLFEKRTPKV